MYRVWYCVKRKLNPRCPHIQHPKTTIWLYQKLSKLSLPCPNRMCVRQVTQLAEGKINCSLRLIKQGCLPGDKPLPCCFSRKLLCIQNVSHSHVSHSCCDQVVRVFVHMCIWGHNLESDWAASLPSRPWSRWADSSAPPCWRSVGTSCQKEITHFCQCVRASGKWKKGENPLFHSRCPLTLIF